MYYFLILTACLFSLASYLLSPTSLRAYAQTPTSITVVPSINQLDLATDKPQEELFYTNNTDQVVTLTFSAQDFTQLEDNSPLSFLNNNNDQNYKYSLSSWLSFNNTNLLILPHQTGSVTVFVNADKLSPGGHYASILAKIETDKDASKNLQVQGILSSLLFVRTHTGHEVDEGDIQTFSLIRSFIEFPQTMLVRFDNSGDTVLAPFGLVQVFNSSGSLMTKGIINEDSLLTLPETIHRYTVPLRKPYTFLLPGWYTAQISLHFGKGNIVKKQTIHFFSEGSIPLVPLGGVLLVGILVAMGIKKRKHVRVHETTE